MPQGWSDLFRPHNLQQLEGDIIPAFLPAPTLVRRQGPADRAGRNRGARRKCAPGAEIGGAASRSYLASVVEVSLRGAGRRIYFAPCAAVWSPSESDLRQGLVPVTLAELRQFRAARGRRSSTRCRRTGFITGADGRNRGRRQDLARSTTAKFIKCVFDQDAGLRPGAAAGAVERQVAPGQCRAVEQLGLFRRIRDAEAVPSAWSRTSSRDRDVAVSGRKGRGFANTPPPLATIELMLDSDGAGRTNNGPWRPVRLCPQSGRRLDAGAQLPDPLSRRRAGLDAARKGRRSEAPDQSMHTLFLELARQLGIPHRRDAPRAGRSAAVDPDFAPEPITRRRHRPAARQTARAGGERPCWRYLPSRRAAIAGSRCDERTGGTAACARRPTMRWRCATRLPRHKVAAHEDAAFTAIIISGQVHRW